MHFLLSVLGVVSFPLILAVSIALFVILLAMLFRTVVTTNTVHTVQSSKKTTSYGTGLSAGNVYYNWPSWVPRFGVAVIKLPVSNFDLSLKDYEAYDLDRVPFMVDVTAFFRIANTTIAAQRVSTFEELHDQLKLIVQGAVRKVLANSKIDDIMTKRSEFGDQFTGEVTEQLKEWGVEPVKSMELMDIRDDANGKSNVISNIMAKKTSHIERESRIEVAENHRAAEMAEIEAEREVNIQKEQALQAVGQRAAERTKAVGIADQQALQEVLKEEQTTKEREMAVRRVAEVKTAEIEKDKQVVAAVQNKETRVIIAEGSLEAERKNAEAIKVIGEAKASAEKAMQLAPVEAQIVLAKEIGTNVGYQQYLLGLEGVKAYEVVGSEQAKALQGADVKVISNAGDAVSGVTKVMDLFSGKGGTQLAAMVEALAQSPLVQSMLKKSDENKKTGDQSKTTETAPASGSSGS